MERDETRTLLRRLIYRAPRYGFVDRRLYEGLERFREEGLEKDPLFVVGTAMTRFLNLSPRHPGVVESFDQTMQLATGPSPRPLEYFVYLHGVLARLDILAEGGVNEAVRRVLELPPDRDIYRAALLIAEKAPNDILYRRVARTARMVFPQTFEMI